MKPAKLFNLWNQRLRQSLSNIPIPSILHSSLVGSHRFATNFDAVHDVDILLIFREFGPKQYAALKSQMKQIASDLTYGSIVVSVELCSGPLKPNLPARRFHHVQLHVLPYSKDEWCRVLSYPGCRDWVDENDHLMGYKLSNLSKIKPLSIESVVRDIAVLKENLNSATAYSRIYEIRGNQLVCKMERIPLTRDQFAQMLVSSSLHAARNASKVWSYKLAGNTAPELPSEYKRLLDEVNTLNSRLKRGEQLAITSAIRAKRKIGQFLDWLECDLSEFSMKDRYYSSETST